MLKHDRPVVGCVGSAVGSVVGGIFCVLSTNRRRRSRSRSRMTSVYLSTYTNFGVLILIMYLVPTCIVGGAPFAPRG
jgi:ABC-type branched-subunit amino acid transport system permease subunit